MRARRGFGGFSLFKFFPKVVNVSSGVRADGKKCILCKKCASVCPTRSIHIDKENRKWYFTPKTCIKCYKCKMACPKKAIRIMP